MSRIVRIATLAENEPTAVDLGMTTPGKLFIQNSGSNDIWVGYDYANVLLATSSNYFTIPAGVMLVFDIGPGVGVLNNVSNMWFSAQGGASTLEVWAATV